MKSLHITSLIFSLEKWISVLFTSLIKISTLSRATILVYHNISSDSQKSCHQNDSVTSADFDQQMQFLQDNSFNVIPLQELVSFIKTGKRIPARTVVITFDDGYKSNFTNACPILIKYGIPATIFLVAGLIGKEGAFPWLEMHSSHGRIEDSSPMDWREVEELHKAGFEIGSHTLSHGFLPKMNDKEIEKEILQSQAIIGERLGQAPQCFALPFSFPIRHRGWPSFEVVLSRSLEKGNYTSCCTMVRGYISSRTNPFLLKRIPIVRFDDLKSFHAKLVGGYAWNCIPQYIFQTFLKKYDKGAY